MATAWLFQPAANQDLLQCLVWNANLNGISKMDHSLKLAKTTLFPFFVFSGGERYFNFNLNQYPQESKAATKRKCGVSTPPHPPRFSKEWKGHRNVNLDLIQVKRHGCVERTTCCLAVRICVCSRSVSAPVLEDQVKWRLLLLLLVKK